MKVMLGLHAPSQDCKFLSFFIVAQIMKEILFLFLYEKSINTSPQSTGSCNSGLRLTNTTLLLFCAHLQRGLRLS